MLHCCPINYLSTTGDQCNLSLLIVDIISVTGPPPPPPEVFARLYIIMMIILYYCNDTKCTIFFLYPKNGRPVRYAETYYIHEHIETKHNRSVYTNIIILYRCTIKQTWTGDFNAPSGVRFKHNIIIKNVYYTIGFLWILRVRGRRRRLRHRRRR